MPFTRSRSHGRPILLVSLLILAVTIGVRTFSVPTLADQPAGDNCGFWQYGASEPAGYQHTTAPDCAHATPETFVDTFTFPGGPMTITVSGGRFSYWAGWGYGTTGYTIENQPCGPQSITVSFSRPVLSVHVAPSGIGTYGSTSITVTNNLGGSVTAQRTGSNWSFPDTALTAPFPGPGMTQVTLTSTDGLGFTLGAVGLLTPENDCYPVKTLEMTAINSPLDTNPNLGGGQRIFPDKLTSGDTVNRTRVRIRAATASGANKVIFFRSYDLDDPSSSAAPVDSNDTSGATGDDNRGVPRLGIMTTAGGTGSTNVVSALTDSNGIALADLTVSVQPGDNFIVAAGSDQTYLNSVAVNGVNLREDGSYGGKLLPTVQAQITPMVTVWRRVHIEMDSMGLVAANQATGRTSTVTPYALANQTDINASTTLEVDRFQGGRIILGSVGTFPVVSNTANRITVQGIINSVPHNTNYTLYDDDDFNGNNGTTLIGDIGENVTSPDTSLIQNSDNPSENVFAPAYVRPIYDVGDNNSSVAFKLNSNTTSAANIIATYDFDAKASEANVNFWTVYLLGAYQAWTTEDADPAAEGAVLGIVDNLNGQGANVFNEVLRAQEITITTVVNNAATTAHEIGHLFNGAHSDGGLMAQSTTRTSIAFDPITIATIRSLAHP